MVLKIKHFQSYKSILELIEINESIKYSCQTTLLDSQKFLLKQGCPVGYSTGTSYQDADCIHGSRVEVGVVQLEKMVGNIDLMKEIIAKQDDILTELYNTKSNIDTRLKSLKGTYYEVAYLRLVEGYSLGMIAERLHVSYGYCKNISSKI